MNLDIKKGGKLKRRSTIDDVAQLAEVSNMTVSRVVNERPNVSKATRKLVLAAMHELSYRPNAMARGMRSDRTMTIGMLLPDVSNATNGVVAQIVSERLQEMGYRFLLGCTGFDVDVELKYLQEFQAGVVDGMILFLADDQDLKTRAALAEMRVPTVLVDRDAEVSLDRVLSEHTIAMTEAVEHLISLGHQRIGVILSPLTMRPGRKRRDAFLNTMRRHDLSVNPAQVLDVAQTVEDGYLAAKKILSNDRPTALIIGANQQLFGAIRAIRELNLSIPRDLSVIGADENQASALIEPPLTMIERNSEEIGKAALKVLFTRINTPDEPRQELILPSSLILRRSCAAPRGSDK